MDFHRRKEKYPVYAERSRKMFGLGFIIPAIVVQDGRIWEGLFVYPTGGSYKAVKLIHRRYEG